MALNDFVVSTPRPLPVILLCDTSGSMSVDGKIEALNEAVKQMVATFSEESRIRAEIQVGLITFGQGVIEHLPLTAAKDITNVVPMQAAGLTPLGAALNRTRMLLEDKEIIPSRAYRPVIVLVSDGYATDDWEAPLEALNRSERASKVSRIAMAIGQDADRIMLEDFIDDPEAPLFEAQHARDIHKFFRAVTMSVTTRTRSANPELAAPIQIQAMPEDDEELDF
ncbi:vWA domain-containing protein [Ferrimonas balearica]|uniref:vWA domain-containing protein n=1 Tax=Ferrimonas balearica TaxID=44012 RepID=UPI001F2D6BB0|nr:VWA domain-containing protein [Ferrimonas balearica]MBY6093952.1 VWA domain-containing protein [Ferrimonas balearica]